MGTGRSTVYVRPTNLLPPEPTMKLNMGTGPLVLLGCCKSKDIFVGVAGRHSAGDSHHWVNEGVETVDLVAVDIKSWTLCNIQSRHCSYHVIPELTATLTGHENLAGAKSYRPSPHTLDLELKPPHLEDDHRRWLNAWLYFYLADSKAVGYKWLKV